MLLASAINVGPVEFPNITSLFLISGSEWNSVSVTNIPATDGFGKLVADPVLANIKYAGHGACVYQLTSDPPAACQSGLLSATAYLDNGFTHCGFSNIGTAAAPKVLLRTGIPTRGVWELDFSPGAGDSAVALYMRDNFLDIGRLPTPLEDVPIPYAPGDSG